jgi:hypothetical protein
MPFQPACFEIFKSASMARFGVVEVDGLWKLWKIHGAVLMRFEGLPVRPDVYLVSVWVDCECRQGTEYLVARPLHLTALDGMIADHMSDGPQGVVFQPPQSTMSNRDTFLSLSRELQDILLRHLDISDVAKLRLSSRCFVQLPQSYFRHLVHTQMPWVWEVSALACMVVDWHRLWKRLALSDGGSGLDEKERAFEVESFEIQKDECIFAIAAKKDMEYPDSSEDDALDARHRQRIAEAKESGRWNLKRPLTEIKGLRNRRRIWKAVEQVQDKIGALTAVECGDEEEDDRYSADTMSSTNELSSTEDEEGMTDASSG